jgi:hypothetical protein
VAVVLPPKLTPSFASGTGNLSPQRLLSWFNAIDKKYTFQQSGAVITMDEVHNFVAKWSTVRVDIAPPIAWINLVWLGTARLTCLCFVM